MKNFCVAAALALLFYTGAARAGEWSFEAAGKARGAYGYSDVSSRFEKYDDNNDTFGDAEIYLSAIYEADEDYTLGLHLDAMAGADKELQDYNQGRWGEEAYAILDTPYGSLQGGQMYNVDYQFYEGAPRVGLLRANTDIVNFIVNPNWRRTDKETKFATLTTAYVNTDGVAPKINYISPELFGFRAGISYIPETYNRRGLINRHADYAEDDGWVGALSAEQDLGWFDLSTSFGYARFHEDDHEFSAGLQLRRGNWSLGGGWRKTYVDGPRDQTGEEPYLPVFFDEYREGRVYEIGIGYEIGPYQSALTYFDAKADNVRSHDKIWMFSNQYQINKYLLVYLAAAHVDFAGTSSAADDNNRGFAFAGGLGLTF